MKLVLQNDAGTAVGEWAVPGTLDANDVEKALAEGLAINHNIEQCDDCGAFVARDDLRERDGDEFVCVACARK